MCTFFFGYTYKYIIHIYNKELKFRILRSYYLNFHFQVRKSYHEGLLNTNLRINYLWKQETGGRGHCRVENHISKQTEDN